MKPREQTEETSSFDNLSEKIKDVFSGVANYSKYEAISITKGRNRQKCIDQIEQIMEQVVLSDDGEQISREQRAAEITIDSIKKFTASQAIESAMERVLEQLAAMTPKSRDEFFKSDEYAELLDKYIFYSGNVEKYNKKLREYGEEFYTSARQIAYDEKYLRLQAKQQENPLQLDNTTNKRGDLPQKSKREGIDGGTNDIETLAQHFQLYSDDELSCAVEKLQRRYEVIKEIEDKCYNFCKEKKDRDLTLSEDDADFRAGLQLRDQRRKDERQIEVLRQILEIRKEIIQSSAAVSQ